MPHAKRLSFTTDTLDSRPAARTSKPADTSPGSEPIDESNYPIPMARQYRTRSSENITKDEKLACRRFTLYATEPLKWRREIELRATTPHRQAEYMCLGLSNMALGLLFQLTQSTCDWPLNPAGYQRTLKQMDRPVVQPYTQLNCGSNSVWVCRSDGPLLNLTGHYGPRDAAAGGICTRCGHIYVKCIGLYTQCAKSEYAALHGYICI